MELEIYKQFGLENVQFGMVEWVGPAAAATTIDEVFENDPPKFILCHTLVISVTGGEANTITGYRGETLLILLAHTNTGTIVVPINYTIKGNKMLFKAPGGNTTRMSVSYQKVWER